MPLVYVEATAVGWPTSSGTLSRQPGSIRAMRDQARALVAVGRIREAVELANRILERSRDPRGSTGWAAIYIAYELVVHGPAEAALGVHRAVARWGRALPADQAGARETRSALSGALYSSGELVAADSLVPTTLDSVPNDVVFLYWHGVIAARRRPSRSRAHVGSAREPHHAVSAWSEHARALGDCRIARQRGRGITAGAPGQRGRCYASHAAPQAQSHAASRRSRVQGAGDTGRLIARALPLLNQATR